MTYFFGGIALDTDLEFRQLERLGERVPHLFLRIDRVSAAAPNHVVFHRSDGRYRLSVGASTETETGDWVFKSKFSDAFTFRPACQRIDCHIVSDNDQAWQDVLFRRVLPRIATTYGATAIHAAAIAIDDRCLLLLGQSGAGKSTLTAFCAQAGWRVLSDDIALIWNGQTVTVEPVHRGMGLWDVTCDALSLPADQLAVMPGYDGRKWCFLPNQSPSSKGWALTGIVSLDRTSRSMPEISPMTAPDAVRALMPQNISFVPADAPSAATAASFGQILTLARRIPCYRLTYPDRYDGLPQTEALLRYMTVDQSRV